MNNSKGTVVIYKVMVRDYITEAKGFHEDIKRSGRWKRITGPNAQLGMPLSLSRVIG
jgi:uncharacterized protein with LGFP repeats